MLISFTFHNFQSYREPVRLSLGVSQHVPQDGRTFVAPSGERLSKVMAIVGANGSGKTALIKGLAFVHWFISDSFHARPDEPIAVNSHFASPGEVSEFQVDFELEGKPWRYRLVASSERVHAESLHVKQSRAYSYVFTRQWEPGQKRYVVKQQQFGMLQKEAEKVRENASLVSTAAQYEVPLAMQLTQRFLRSNLNVLGRKPIDHDQLLKVSQFYARHEHLRTRMAHLLSQWDLGLSDVRLQKQTITRDNGETEDVHLPFGIHRVGHEEHALVFFHESSGTQGAFLLLSRLLPVLETGGLAVIDELEADLHPHMLVPILDLFFSSNTNPHNAQLIFTCHSMEVLSLLHKAQVVLVEKDSDCCSDAWRLDTVKGVRADDNLYAKYMAGAYGAVPIL